MAKSSSLNKMPLQFEDDANSAAPYTVRCLSMEGEVWRISGVDFYRWVLKDKTTVSLLHANLKERYQIWNKTSENRHDEFKFAHVEVPEVDSVLDEASTGYVSSDAEDKKAQQQQRPEKLVLKDLLVEAGTDYREQLDEMVKGFPKVKKALNLEDSVSEWRDSQDSTCSAIDKDDDAFSKVEQTILSSYQAFTHQKYKDQPDKEKKQSMTGQAMAVKSMRDMTKQSFKEAAEQAKNSPRTAVTKLQEVKKYVSNQFGTVAEKEKPLKKAPSVKKVAAVEIRKANLASAGERQEYVSSSLLNAYK